MCSSDPAPKIIDSVREVSRTGVSKLVNAELFMHLFSFVKILPLSVRSLALDVNTFESGLYMYNLGGGSGGEGGGMVPLSRAGCASTHTNVRSLFEHALQILSF